jgi:hypothetical protein
VIPPGTFHSPGDPVSNAKIQRILRGWGLGPKPKRASKKSERTTKKKPRQAPKER